MKLAHGVAWADAYSGNLIAGERDDIRHTRKHITRKYRASYFEASIDLITLRPSPSRLAAHGLPRGNGGVATPRKTPQIKITIPKGERADVAAAMKWDGVDKLSQFALAAIRQRVRRIKRQMEIEAAADEAQK